MDRLAWSEVILGVPFIVAVTVLGATGQLSGDALNGVLYMTGGYVFGRASGEVRSS